VNRIGLVHSVFAFPERSCVSTTKKAAKEVMFSTTWGSANDHQLWRLEWFNVEFGLEMSNSAGRNCGSIGKRNVIAVWPLSYDFRIDAPSVY
jgi:hypothetical protein